MKANAFCLWFLSLLVSGSAFAQDVLFERVVIDDAGPKDPWVKTIGDIDNDGYTDVVIGGRGGPVVWYRYPDWKKTEIAKGGYSTVDGETGDMDGDGDLDVVIGAEFWYENPLPNGDPAQAQWTTHCISDMRTHDVELGDLDGDGDLDLVARDQSGFNHNAGNQLHFWQREESNQWTYRALDCPHGEGLHFNDIDLDGDLDIVTGGSWFENTGDILNGAWTETKIAPGWHPDTAVQAGDINGDGRMDVALTRSEGEYKLSWFEAPVDPKQPNWREHPIDPSVDFAHGLALADMDGDGDLDVVTAEMHQSERDRLLVYYNEDNGATWNPPQILSTRGLHNLRVADFGSDGSLDIMGANWSGDFQPVELWLSQNKAQWVGDYQYRIPITVHANGKLRTDKPVEVEIDLSQVAKEVGENWEFHAGGYRLTEPGKQYSGSNQILNQMEPLGGNQGLLTFIMPSRTEPLETRTFMLYVPLVKKTVLFAGPSPVFVEDNKYHSGQNSYRIGTHTGTFFFHRQGAGFASMYDRDGNDWLSYQPGNGPAGEYRGIPNLSHPEGYFHPGSTNGESAITHSQTQIKATITSVSDDKNWECRWDIFPTYARLTVLKTAKPYWFLYEGTPGGKLDIDTDYCIRPGNIRTPLSEKWTGDLSAPNEPGEWVTFGDGNRQLFLIQHEGDDKTDSFWQMQEAMTVFGFGRDGLEKYLVKTPMQFTIGFCDGSDYIDIQRAIHNAYIPLKIKAGPLQKKDS